MCVCETCCNDEHLEVDSELSKLFAQAADNPQDFDFGFAQEREPSGYANFGFDPETAAAMRDAELNPQRDDAGLNE